MSVTFYCPEAPRKEVPCSWCKKYREESPELLHDGTGTEKVSEAPKLNFANVNAAGILRLLGLLEGRDLWGEIAHEEIPAVLRVLLRVLNSEAARSHLVAIPYDGPAYEPRIVDDDGMARISTGPRIVYGGNTDKQTCWRLRQVRDLLVYASENGYRVAWG